MAKSKIFFTSNHYNVLKTAIEHGTAYAQGPLLTAARTLVRHGAMTEVRERTFAVTEAGRVLFEREKKEYER